jgi:predicted tellurium resistance membrane protein TerC
MSPKLWVVVTGGILGIVAMRLVAGQLIALVQRYPAIVDGAFIIIASIGVKLALEYLHEAHYTTLEIPRWLSLGLVVIIFIISFIYAKLQGPAPAEGDTLAKQAEHLLEEEAADDVAHRVAK